MKRIHETDQKDLGITLTGSIVAEIRGNSKDTSQLLTVLFEPFFINFEAL